MKKNKLPTMESVRTWLQDQENIFATSTDDYKVLVAAIALARAGAQGPYLRKCEEILSKYNNICKI